MNNDDSKTTLEQQAKNLADEHGIDHHQYRSGWGNLEFTLDKTEDMNHDGFLGDMLELGLVPQNIFGDGIVYFRPIKQETETVTVEKEVEKEVYQYK